jgi:hypothetical protein
LARASSIGGWGTIWSLLRRHRPCAIIAS